MNNDQKYEDLYNRFVSYQTEVHEKNQARIRIGLKVNIFFPLVFLILCFLTNGSKLIFLILWIVSLFGIAFYLMYVEYSDDKLLRQMQNFGIGGSGTMEENEALIGSVVEDTQSKALSHMDHVENAVEEKKQEIASKISDRKKNVKKGLEKKKKTLRRQLRAIGEDRRLTPEEAREKRLAARAARLRKKADALQKKAESVMKEDPHA